MGDPRYFSALVIDNQDPDKQGRLQLQIPALSGDDPYPDWVPHLGAGAGPGATGGWFPPPAEAIVVVTVDDADRVWWMGSEFGAKNSIPPFLVENYGKRGGASSPDGRHVWALDNDSGFLLLVANPDDAKGPKNYVALGTDGTFKAGTHDGATLVLSETQAAILSPAGDVLLLDVENGVVLAQAAGTSSLALLEAAAKLSGTAVQINGGTIELGDGVTPPLNPYLLTLSFFADLALVLPEIVAIGAGIPSGLAVPAPNAGTMAGKIATSLGAGAPYLSTRITGD